MKAIEAIFLRVWCATPSTWMAEIGARLGRLQ
jgi:hypothetical protein